MSVTFPTNRWLLGYSKEEVQLAKGRSRTTTTTFSEQPPSGLIHFENALPHFGYLSLELAETCKNHLFTVYQEIGSVARKLIFEFGKWFLKATV